LREQIVSSIHDEDDLSPLIPAAQLMAAISPTLRITDLVGRVAASEAARERFSDRRRAHRPLRAD
jgi:hypothetical protein